MKLTRSIYLVLFLIILASSVVACGQPEPEIITVGIVSRVPSLDPVVEGFKSRMTELGYVEGKSINYIYEGAITDPAKVDPYLQQLVEKNVDLIFAVTTDAATAAQKMTDKTPIIFAPVNNPVEAGLVENLTKPGHNVTGITNAGGDPRRLQWLADINPQIKRVYVPYSAKDLPSATAFASINETAQELNIELVPYDILNLEQNAQAIADIPEDVDAIFLVPDNNVIPKIKDWSEAAKQKKLPISVPQVFPGALTSFCFDSFKMGEQAARLGDQILKGAKPGDLPVENAEFFLTIDLATAEAIGLEISDAVLEQADTLIRNES